MFKINYPFLLPLLLILSIFNSSLSQGQEVTPTIIPLGAPIVVDFTKLANYEKIHPVKKKKRYIEQGEDREKNGNFIPQPVPPNASTFNIKPPSKLPQVQTVSAAPVLSFNGTLDNGTLIPPDIRGTAGLSHVMETTNQEFKIYTKAGSLVSTLSISTFFNGSGGTNYFDPHIIYDANNSRYVVCIAGDIASNGHSGLFLAVSQTNNPTGLWFVYGFDATGNTSDFMDYPLLGLNTNWVVITGRNFTGAGPVVPKIFVFNRSTVYGGSAGTISSFTDPTNSLTIAPAHTFDAAQTTEYLVCNWNGNSGGSGFVRLSSITGTASSPVYSVGSTIGVASPWNDNGSITTGASQSGTTTKIESGDSRIGNAVFVNGSLWFCHTAYLPATSPNHAAADWWQVNPVTPAVQQFGRVEEATTFNYYSSISVNSNNDVLLGYCTSSSTAFASAAYSFRAGTDAPNTMQSSFIYKTGLASYNKTFGSGRNRYGDYTGMAVDPANNSFWNFSEWANTGNNWGTVIANVAGSGPAVLSTITTSPVLPLNYCAGASVNVSFTINNAANAGNVFTAQLSNAAGSFSSPVAIGTITSTTAGTISATIPANTATGSGYRIRVVSSLPSVTGTDNGSNITISAQVAAAGPINTAFTSFCGGLPITFTVGNIANATTYTWTPPAGASISSGQGTTTCVIAFPASGVSGNVSVFGSNANCTGASSTLAVTANPVPSTPTAGNVSGCTGSAIALSGTPSGGSFSVANPYTGPSTTYTYTVINAFGCVATSLPANITVNTLPVPVISGNTAFCAGNSTTLNAGSGFNSYNWSTGATTQNISVNNSGTFTVTVTNAGGCSGTASVVTTVNSNPSVSISGNLSFCSGSSSVLNAGSGFNSYSWSTGATTQTISVNNSGTFTVTVANAGGCTGTASVVTTVNSNPSVTISGNLSFCLGASSVLNAGSGFNSYNWSTGATTQTISVSNSGTFTVTVTNAGGCSGTASVVTTVNSNPSVTISGNLSFCSGASSVLNAGNGFNSYSWSTGATTQTISVNTAGTYTVTVSNAGGCTAESAVTTSLFSDPIPSISGNTSFCNGSSTILDAGAGYNSYSWSTGSSTQTISVNTAGSFTVTVTNGNGCSGIASVFTTVNALPAVSFSGLASTYIITDGAATLIGSPPGGTFSGNGISGNVFDPSIAGIGGPYTITYTYTDGNGCTNASSLQTTVNNCAAPAQPGTISQVGGTTKVCPGDNKTYNISLVSGATSYTWTPPTGAVISSGQGTKTVTVNYQAGFVASGILSVVANNSCGGSLARTKSITRNTPLTPGAISGQASGVCNLSGVPYQVTAVSGMTYNWSFTTSAASIAAGQGSNSVTADYISGFTTGNLNVTAGNACGVSSPRTLSIKSVPATPGAITGSTGVCANQFGVPYSIVPVAGASNYTWNAPSGSKISDGVTTSSNATFTTTAASVTVNFGSTAGSVKVKANSACGSSSNKSKAVSFICRNGVARGLNNLDLVIYPNPATTELAVHFLGNDNENYQINLSDVIGKAIVKKSGASVQGQNDVNISLTDLPKGIYTLEVSCGNRKGYEKVVVQ